MLLRTALWTLMNRCELEYMTGYCTEACQTVLIGIRQIIEQQILPHSYKKIIIKTLSHKWDIKKKNKTQTFSLISAHKCFRIKRGNSTFFLGNRLIISRARPTMMLTVNDRLSSCIRNKSKN